MLVDGWLMVMGLDWASTSVSLKKHVTSGLNLNNQVGINNKDRGNFVFF